MCPAPACELAWCLDQEYQERGEEADIDILRPQTLTLKCWTCFWPRSLQFYSSFMRMREEKSWMCHAMQASQNHSIYLCDTPWLRWCNQSNQHWNMIILPQNCHYNLRNFQPLKLKLLPTISGQPRAVFTDVSIVCVSSRHDLPRPGEDEGEQGAPHGKGQGSPQPGSWCPNIIGKSE